MPVLRYCCISIIIKHYTLLEVKGAMRGLQGNPYNDFPAALQVH